MTATHPHGLFSWTDLALPDPETGKDFYVELFGWDPQDETDAEGNHVYTMFRKDGKLVAGLGPQPPEQREEGIPPLWGSYITVDDIDVTVDAVTEYGGTVLVGPMDVLDAGRMAWIADPGGAVVGLWQEGSHAGAEQFGDSGFMTWNELATRDVEQALDFYLAVLPWKVETSDFGGMRYHTINLNDAPNGGMLQMDDNWPSEVPPHWMVYFRVADVDVATERVKQLGGSVSVLPTDTPAGRFAVVSDPQGGTFSILGPSPEE